MSFVNFNNESTVGMKEYDDDDHHLSSTTATTATPRTYLVPLLIAFFSVMFALFWVQFYCEHYNRGPRNSDSDDGDDDNEVAVTLVGRALLVVPRSNATTATSTTTAEAPTITPRTKKERREWIQANVWTGIVQMGQHNKTGQTKTMTTTTTSQKQHGSTSTAATKPSALSLAAQPSKVETRREDGGHASVMADEISVTADENEKTKDDNNGALDNDDFTRNMVDASTTHRCDTMMNLDGPEYDEENQIPDFQLVAHESNKSGDDDEDGAPIPLPACRPCDICLVEYEIGDLVARSRNKECIHPYHEECIVHWLLRNTKCPVCRREYIADENESK